LVPSSQTFSSFLAARPNRPIGAIAGASDRPLAHLNRVPKPSARRLRLKSHRQPNAACRGTGTPVTFVRAGLWQLMELIMATRNGSRLRLRTPLVRRAPTFPTSGREWGVIAITAPVLLNFLFLWIHGPTSDARSLWAEIRPMVPPSSALDDFPRETITGPTSWARASTR
jgi:hypothetical protein